MPFPCVDDARNQHYRIYLNLHIHSRLYISRSMKFTSFEKVHRYNVPLIRVYIKPIIFVLNTYQVHETTFEQT